MKLKRLSGKDISSLQSALEDFERNFIYPLGSDSFRISHGKDYLNFFRRMGRDNVYAYVDNQKIAALGAGVIQARHKAWYLCDMKVHPDYRGKKLPVKLFRGTFFQNYIKCQRGYALTMEDGPGQKNPIMKIMENLPWTPLKKGARVFFFYEPKRETELAMAILSFQRKNISFSSLAGIKELILSSTGQPIPLLHMEWGEGQIGQPASENALHMWCLWEGNTAIDDLVRVGIKPKGSGLIFQHRMPSGFWNELRTSEL